MGSKTNIDPDFHVWRKPHGRHPIFAAPALSLLIATAAFVELPGSSEGAALTKPRFRLPAVTRLLASEVDSHPVQTETTLPLTPAPTLPPVIPSPALPEIRAVIEGSPQVAEVPDEANVNGPEEIFIAAAAYPDCAARFQLTDAGAGRTKIFGEQFGPVSEMTDEEAITMDVMEDPASGHFESLYSGDDVIFATPEEVTDHVLQATADVCGRIVMPALAERSL